MARCICLCEGNHYILWNDGAESWYGIPYRLVNLITGRHGSRAPGVDFVALGPNESWFVKFMDGRIRFENLPSALVEVVQQCVECNNNINFVAIGPNGSYVLISYSAIFWQGVPQSLNRILSQKRTKVIKEVSLGTNGTWAIGYTDGTYSVELQQKVYPFFEAVRWPDFVCLDPKRDYYCIIGDNDKCFANGSQNLINQLFCNRYQFRVLIDEVYYLQSSINNHFQSGYSIYDLAKKLALNEIDINIIPIIRVVQDNGENENSYEEPVRKYWSLDNRRLWVFKNAGLKSIPVNVVSPNPQYYRLRAENNSGVTVQVRTLNW